jgi:hypothetical protein
MSEPLVIVGNGMAAARSMPVSSDQTSNGQGGSA